MKSKDVKCPICNHTNKGVNLDETDGWFICDKCQSEVKLIAKTELIPIKVLTMKELAANAAAR